MSRNFFYNTNKRHSGILRGGNRKVNKKKATCQEILHATPLTGCHLSLMIQLGFNPVWLSGRPLLYYDRFRHVKPRFDAVQHQLFRGEQFVLVCSGTGQVGNHIHDFSGDFIGQFSGKHFIQR